MSRNHLCCSVVVLILSTLLTGLGFTPKALGQAREQNQIQSEITKKAPVFKSNGAISKTKPPQPAPPPPVALTTSAVKALIGNSPGTVYAKVTPSQPRVTNRAVLMFSDPHALDGGYWNEEGVATWGNGATPSTGNVTLEVKASANKKYLIDCAVKNSAYSPAAPYAVVEYTSGDTFALDAVNGHLVFLLDTQSAGWREFTISRNSAWSFYSCEITNLASGS
jgi:hypothetical protein